MATCGDGYIWNEEEGNEICDDNNTNPHDECTDECKVATCGDNKVHNESLGKEQCDDGKDGDNTDECLDTCKNPSCGDEFVQAGEDCDDGNHLNDDDCIECKNW